MSLTSPMDHMKVLCAEIGPRGPTTEAEARAAAYAAAKLEDAGANDVSVQLFRSVPSMWWAMEISLVLALSSTAIYYFCGACSPIWIIAPLILSLYAAVAELSFWKLSLSNFLPKRISQNVSARIPPRGPARKKLVLIGHLDTSCTPIFFRERIVRFLPLVMIVTLGSVLVKALLFAFGPLAFESRTVLIVALALDAPIFLTLLAELHGDLFSPVTEGANDNASAAAVVLSLAERFAREPLEQTEVWALCTGCEEATLTGIGAFLDKRGDELKNAYFVDLECVGIGDLKFITSEGMLKKYHSNPGLIRAAAEAAEAVGDDKIVGMPLESGYSETAIVLKRGFSGITIMAMPEGAKDAPHRRQMSDRIDNIEPETVDRAMEYVTALAKELDAG